MPDKQTTENNRELQVGGGRETALMSGYPHAVTSIDGTQGENPHREAKRHAVIITARKKK